MPLTDEPDEKLIPLLRVLSPRPLLSSEDTRRFFVKFQEIEKIRLAINTHENVLLIGERGSGKTSLFNYMYYHFMDEKSLKPIVPVYFSVLGLSEFNQSDFLKSLISHIFSAALKFQTNSEKFRNVVTKLFLSPETRTKISQSQLPEELEIQYGIQKKDDLGSLSNKLLNLVEKLHAKNIQFFVMLDDTDKIESELVWSAFRGIRDLLWETKTSIIISALPEQVSEITKPPLDQFFPYWIKMTPFGVNLAKELIEKRLTFAQSDIEISDDVIQHIVEKTNGNPRSIIALAKNLFESYDVKNKLTVDQIEELDSPFSSNLTDIERTAINYLVHNPFTSASSKDFERTVSVTRSRLSQILNELKTKGLIGSRKEGKRMKYFITNQGLLKQTSSEKNVITIIKGAASSTSNPHFEPITLEIKKGQILKWRNRDSAGHTITSGLPSDKESGVVFDSHLIKPDNTYEFMFDKSGTFDYFCLVHPWGTGKIIVKE